MSSVTLWFFYYLYTVCGILSIIIYFIIYCLDTVCLVYNFLDFQLLVWLKICLFILRGIDWLIDWLIDADWIILTARHSTVEWVLHSFYRVEWRKHIRRPCRCPLYHNAPTPDPSALCVLIFHLSLPLGCLPCRLVRKLYEKIVTSETWCTNVVLTFSGQTVTF